ncbi:sporulation-delaying protein SdpB family protein [Bacillus nakamurai]|uniref:sporulation-delaying protein SdpB family protein n=1 Tax=Bacillus nakamurai TaxID=1793963 RepID=UPI0028153ABE|nr:sporulation-delaying protein SdpB family protein [Bacillus nakamurai]
MMQDAKKQLTSWIMENPPWTNVYGLARSLIALGTLLTLLFNPASVFFKTQNQVLDFSNTFSLFLLFPDFQHIEIIKAVCVCILVLVVIGWRPRLTGFFHWWISYSFQNSAVTLDGGDQIAAVFTLLLLPLTLTDPRKWHWAPYEESYAERRLEPYYRSLCWATLTVIRIQVAMLYFNSIVAKLMEEEWQNGTAVYYYLNDPMLGLPDALHGLFDFMLQSKLVMIPTWGTLIVQTIMFCALFAPKKYWRLVLFISIFMHEIFAVMLGLTSFSITVSGILVLFLIPAEKTVAWNHFTKPFFRYNFLNKRNRRKIFG